ncbi:hypothetical protein MUK42_12589 [Musa troglodytarum]|uniref:Uncharacterized protein n=1 Tax=Musa troglodytarum TaxID=320322 RepID=A0A9E7HHV3_9LILI|nr:hypothetical protein MUK42_12589 [Musa troglodytarum]
MKADDTVFHKQLVKLTSHTNHEVEFLGNVRGKPITVQTKEIHFQFDHCRFPQLQNAVLTSHTNHEVEFLGNVRGKPITVQTKEIHFQFDHCRFPQLQNAVESMPSSGTACPLECSRTREEEEWSAHHRYWQSYGAVRIGEKERSTGLGHLSQHSSKDAAAQVPKTVVESWEELSKST